MLIKCQTEFKLKKDSIIRFDDKPLIRFLIVFYYPSTGDSPVESLETLELFRVARNLKPQQKDARDSERFFVQFPFSDSLFKI